MTSWLSWCNALMRFHVISSPVKQYVTIKRLRLRDHKSLEPFNQLIAGTDAYWYHSMLWSLLFLLSPIFTCFLGLSDISRNCLKLRDNHSLDPFNQLIADWRDSIWWSIQSTWFKNPVKSENHPALWIQASWVLLVISCLLFVLVCIRSVATSPIMCGWPGDQLLCANNLCK